MRDKVVYILSVANPNGIDPVRGVYTNKKILFDSMESIFKENGYDDISFNEIYGYNDKKFNYANVTAIVRTLKVNESFSLKLTKSKTGESIIVNISSLMSNELILKLE